MNCGTPAGVRDHIEQGEPLCPACRARIERERRRAISGDGAA